MHVDRGPEAVPFARHVTLHVSAEGALEAKRLRHQIMALLAEQPRALLCDLSAVTEPRPELAEVFRGVSRHVNEWPGTPVAVVCQDERFRSWLTTDAGCDRLLVGPSAAVVSELLARTVPAEHATMTLDPGLTAPRAARAFVARACLRWQALSVTGHACLVTSELVTNAVLHAHTAVRLTVSHCPGRLRIAVQDGDEMRPATAWTLVDEPVLTGSGRGLLLVSSVCRAWGVYPVQDDGKVVWAVLDVPSSVAGAGAGSALRSTGVRGPRSASCR